MRPDDASHARRRHHRAAAARRSLGLALVAAAALSCCLFVVSPAFAATLGKPVAKTPSGTVTTARPTFTWSKASGAHSYELRVYRGHKLLIDKKSLARTSWRCTMNLPLYAKLTWKIRAWSGKRAGLWSASATFKVDPNVPQGTTKALQPTFAWAKVKGAKRYELRVYQGTKLLVKKTGITKTSWKCTILPPSYAPLTWKVRGSAGRRVLRWSKTFRFTIAAPAAQMAVYAGDAQSVVAGEAVPVLPSVLVADAKGRAVPGAPVTFAAAAGGGGVTGAAALTDASGIATVGGWTLGPTAGADSLTASCGAVAPVTFHATGIAGAADAAASTLAATTTTITADGTSTTTITVTVTDANGNPVDAGAGAVAITALFGADTIGPVVDNGDGTYSAVVTAPTTTGSSTFVATLNGSQIDGGGTSQVEIVVTYAAGPPAAMSATAGDQQTAIVGQDAPIAPTVTVVDAHDNPVPGVQVAFAVTGGGGSIPTTTAITDASGTASPGPWTMGTAAGVGNDTLTATCDGCSGSPVTFTDTALTGPPATLSLSAGDAQTAAVGHDVPVAPSVLVVDAYGNPVTGAAVTFGVQTGGGSVAGGDATTDTSGIATVTSWTLGTVAGTDSLTAACEGCSGSPVTFDATAAPGPLASFALDLASSQWNGQPFVGSDTVTALDAYGNTITGYSALADPVTISASPADGTISGLGLEGAAVLDQPSDFVAGVADLSGTMVFTGLAGSHTFTATSQIEAATGTSAAVSVAAGAPTGCTLTIQPGGAVDGLALSTAPVVQLRDASGNSVAAAGVSVVATIASGSGTLSGTTTATTSASGAATFSNLIVTGTTGAYRLTFTPTSLTAVTSSSFTLAAGAAAKAAITTQPAGAVNGVAFTTQPVIRIQDVGGNNVNAAAVNVVASINTGTGTLSGTTTVQTNASGVATFTNLALTGTAGSFKLDFTPSGLTSATSGNVQVTPGTADATQSTLTPTSASITANGTATQVLTVKAYDSSGNALTSGGATVTITRQSGSGSIGTVTDLGNGSYTATVTAPTSVGNGVFVATLNGGAVKSGSAGQTQATVSYVPGAAAKLAIVTQPVGGASGGVLATQPVVQVQDAQGNLVTSSSATVTVTSSAGSTIGGSQAAGLAASGGVATFTNLTLAGTAGTNYTLTFAASGLTSATSSNVTVTFGTATKLAITTQPVGGASGAVLATQPVVKVEDSAGNVVSTSSASITASSSAGSTIGGTTSLAASSGVATFTNLTLAGTAGTNYTLTFAASGLTSATSGNVQVTPGTADATQSTLTPTSASITANGTATQVLTVKAYDSSGNALTSGGATVTITRQSGSGSIGTVTDLGNGSYTATVTAPTSVGNGVFVATLNGGAVKSGSAGQTQATVSYVPGAAAKLAIVTQPVGGASGGVLATQPVVQVQDAQGNLVTSSSATVTVTSSAGSTIGGSQAAGLAASGGVATFTNLTLAGTAGTNYTLTFAASGLTSATSSNVTVTFGTATKLAITTQPVGGASGAVLATQPVVKVEDSAGNVVSTSSASITASSSAGSTIGGTTSLAASSGVATFTNLTLAGTAGTNYTLTFAASGLTSATSSSVTVTFGTATKLAITTQPVGGACGATLATEPVVQVQDAQGNLVTSSSATVTVTSSAGSTIGGTTSLAASSGVATFTNLTLAGTAGTNYTLTFAASGLTSATSSNVTVTVGAATKGVITTQPAGAVNGVALTTQPVVRLQDAGGNNVSTSGVNVVATVASGSGALSGTTTVQTNTSGIATFTNLVVTGTVGSYTLTFTPTSLTAATSNAFTLTAGAAAKCTLTTQPGGAVDGLALSTAPVVQLQDASGNSVSSASVNVVATIASGSGTLSGTTTVSTNASGQATFSNLIVTGTVGSYTLTFTPTSLTAVTSSSFTLAAGAATKCTLTTQPAGAVNGAAFTTQPVVQLQDVGGNSVSTSGVNVVASINTGTGTLSGTTTVQTNASGVATFTNLALTGTAGSFKLDFTPTSLTKATSSSFTLGAGAATKGVLTTQPSGAVDGIALTGAPVVQLQDSGGNNVSTSGVSVVATIASGSGTLSGTTTVSTNASGQATFSNLIVTGTTGSYTLTFTPTSLTAVTSSSFTLGIGAASKIALNAGDNQVASPSTAVAVNPSVLVTDVGNNPVSGTAVTFAIGSGGGTLTGGSATSNASGIATVGSWTMSATIGAETLTATSGTLSGSPVTFHATAIAIGSYYGGGVVAYILKSGDPGYTAGQCHGFIAAVTDQSSAAIWALAAYQNTAVGTTGTALGTGAANTTAVIAQNGAGTGYAAGLAHAYNGGGYTDWYLPSKDELNQLYTNRAAINTTALANSGTAFAAAYYWSSSEGDAYDAWLQHFGNGSVADFVKGLGSPAVSVRAVRSF